RHQAQNLRRNGQPKRPAGPRRDARPRQDLQETENFLLRLPRRPPWHSRARNPPARDPRQPRPKLTAARKFAPVTVPNENRPVLGASPRLRANATFPCEMRSRARRRAPPLDYVHCRWRRSIMTSILSPIPISRKEILEKSWLGIDVSLAQDSTTRLCLVYRVYIINCRRKLEGARLT